MKTNLLKTGALAMLLGASAAMPAQEKASITLHADQGKNIISKHIYGQFAEHLGTCIYGGLWVGEGSSIPNTQGYRNDVLAALKDLSIPNLRWPGGCFADEYHWMDGIGPRSERPRMVNTNWGGTVEDNSFGTHEFLNLCELLGCEPYISGNVGSGSVEEMAKWVEYVNAQDGPMAKLRKQNGREKPWNVKFFGVGNESWGCGGSMRPEYYADLYRRYSTYCRNYNGNNLFKIASGASDYDYNWTEVLMQNVGARMQGLSLHYYSIIDWNNKGKATEFTDDDYYNTLGKCLEIEPVIKKHIAIMDKYDLGPGTRHHPRTPVPAKHPARCHGGRTHPQRIPQIHRPHPDGQHCPDCQRVAVHDSDPRRQNGAHPHLPRVQDVQGTPGRHFPADRPAMRTPCSKPRPHCAYRQRHRLTQPRRRCQHLAGQHRPQQDL